MRKYKTQNENAKRKRFLIVMAVPHVARLRRKHQLGYAVLEVELDALAPASRKVYATVCVCVCMDVCSSAVVVWQTNKQRVQQKQPSKVIQNKRVIEMFE